MMDALRLRFLSFFALFALGVKLPSASSESLSSCDCFSVVDRVRGGGSLSVEKEY